MDALPFRQRTRGQRLEHGLQQEARVSLSYLLVVELKSQRQTIALASVQRQLPSLARSEVALQRSWPSDVMDYVTIVRQRG